MECYEITHQGAFNGIKLDRLTNVVVGTKIVPISRDLLNHQRSIRDEYLLEAHLVKYPEDSSGQTQYVLGGTPIDQFPQRDRALVRLTMTTPAVSTVEMSVEGDRTSLVVAKDQTLEFRNKTLHALLVLKKNSPVLITDSYEDPHKCDFVCKLVGGHKRVKWNRRVRIEYDGNSIKFSRP